MRSALMAFATLYAVLRILISSVAAQPSLPEDFVDYVPDCLRGGGDNTVFSVVTFKTDPEVGKLQDDLSYWALPYAKNLGEVTAFRVAHNLTMMKFGDSSLICVLFMRKNSEFINGVLDNIAPPPQGDGKIFQPVNLPEIIRSHNKSKYFAVIATSLSGKSATRKIKSYSDVTAISAAIAANSPGDRVVFQLVRDASASEFVDAASPLLQGKLPSPLWFFAWPISMQSQTPEKPNNRGFITIGFLRLLGVEFFIVPAENNLVRSGSDFAEFINLFLSDPSLSQYDPKNDLMSKLQAKDIGLNAAHGAFAGSAPVIIVSRTPLNEVALSSYQLTFKER